MGAWWRVCRAQWSKYRRVPCKLLLHVVLVITLTIHVVRYVDVVRGRIRRLRTHEAARAGSNMGTYGYRHLIPRFCAALWRGMACSTAPPRSRSAVTSPRCCSPMTTCNTLVRMSQYRTPCHYGTVDDADVSAVVGVGAAHACVAGRVRVCAGDSTDYPYGVFRLFTVADTVASIDLMVRDAINWSDG